MIGEAGALFASHPFWVWLAVGAVFLAIEVVTGSGWLLWPAGSAAVVAVALLILPQLSAPAQIVVFGVCTIATTYVGRRFLTGAHPVGPDVNDPHSRLIGHRGEAAAPFVDGDGRVFVDGKEWSAELDGPGPIAAGAKVEVVAVVGGARLRVRPA